MSRSESHAKVIGFSCPLADSICQLVPLAVASHLAEAKEE